MNGHRGSILLVDDEEKILKALGRALRAAGHEIVETTNPRQALRLLAERPFDVLVVDNIMPETSGLDLIREFVAGSEGRTDVRDARSAPPAAQRGNGASAERVRAAAERGEGPQIVMMTAHATVESAIEAMKLGAFEIGRASCRERV